MKSRTSIAIRVAALAVISIVAAAKTGDASEKCLKLDKKTCTFPESCMFERQIAMKRALRDLYLSGAMRCAALAKAGSRNPPRDDKGNPKSAADILNDLVDGRTGRIGDKLAKCKDSKLQDPPGWVTDDSCTFQAKGADGKAVDPEGSNTCSEFLDASREHEREHVRYCKAARDGKEANLGEWSAPKSPSAACSGVHWNGGASKVPDRKDLNDFADEEADGYTSEIWELEDMRAAAIHACTTARADAEAAAKGAKEKTTALKQIGGVR
jgi:hypothetical protein